jgi:crossover junction endodeoxyribonuclease RuvC
VRIVGIDPGSHKLGWGVLECVGSRLTHIASGTLKAAAGPLPERLLQLHRQLSAHLVTYAPHIAAVETMYHAKNTQSVFVLAQARGAALLALAQAGLTVNEYSPSQIKQAATGRGNSDKEQVRAMVERLLQIPPNSRPLGQDQSDALACALCHAQHAPALRRLAAL